MLFDGSSSSVVGMSKTACGMPQQLRVQDRHPRSPNLSPRLWQVYSAMRQLPHTRHHHILTFQPDGDWTPRAVRAAGGGAAAGAPCGSS